MTSNRRQKRSEKDTHLSTKIFDILFVLMLCYITLLIPMLMRGKVIVGSGAEGGGLQYSFSFLTFLLTFLVLGVYLAFVISNSNKELKSMIKKKYD